MINTEIEIEKQVLGALLVEPKLITENYDKLGVHLFSALKNQQIFEAMIQIWDKHEVLDLSILSRELDKKNHSELITYAIELAKEVSTTAHVEFHLMLLVQSSVKRDFIQKFSNLLNFAQTPERDIFDIRDKAFEYFDNLFLDTFIENHKGTKSFIELIKNVETKFENIQENKPTGLKSSLEIINKAFGGWQNSDLVIVAGRPGMGKTAFLVQQVIDIAKQNKAVGVFSLEMSSEQITTRIVANFTNIPNSSFLRKGLKEDELQKYILLKPNLNDMKIHIDDTSSLSIQNLKMKAKMMKLRHNIEILFVDYLQLITHSKTQNREQEISYISRQLKSIAKDLNIPVIALSQLSRNVEQRADKRPLLSDLRDSGAIEQDADAVIFLFRPEYYGIENWGNEYNNESTNKEAEVIIQKNRNGGLLYERCRVDMPTSKFMNMI